MTKCRGLQEAETIDGVQQTFPAQFVDSELRKALVVRCSQGPLKRNLVPRPGRIEAGARKAIRAPSETARLLLDFGRIVQGGGGRHDLDQRSSRVGPRGRKGIGVRRDVGQNPSRRRIENDDMAKRHPGVSENCVNTVHEFGIESVFDPDRT